MSASWAYNFKTATIETVGNIHVSEEDAGECYESHGRQRNQMLRKAVIRVNRILKIQTTYFGHVMRREKLKYPLTTIMILFFKAKHSKGKQKKKSWRGGINYCTPKNGKLSDPDAF